MVLMNSFFFIWHSNPTSMFFAIFLFSIFDLWTRIPGDLYPDLLDCQFHYHTLLTIDAYGEVTFDNELVEVSLALPVIEPSSPTSRPVTPVMMSQSGGVGSYQRQTSTPSSSASAFQRQMSSTPTSVPAVKPTPVTSLALPPNTGK